MRSKLKLVWCVMSLALVSAGSPRPSGEDIVRIDASGAPVNIFVPDQALGAALDGLPAGQIERLYTPHNVRAAKSAGLGPVSLSLRTDLANDAWHWSEEGSWSDPDRHQGYWTSSDDPKQPVLTGWGYSLARRGNTVDQANDDGYSRLDDGDPATFWKSNPYLDPAYTKAVLRPQWVVVTFDRARAISAARIDWAEPHARAFKVQHWSCDDPYDDDCRWIDFPDGIVTEGNGGNAILRLSKTPLKAKFVRFLLETSSGTAPAGSKDARDSMGYAISEIGVGSVDAQGRFLDAVHHAADGASQTNIYVSSTDPWHRASDRDMEAEQPGFDRIFGSGFTGGQPMVAPVGVLYDTPENAAAEIRFLRRRGYPVHQIEIGEEPDGQNISPEDFAELYRQFGAAVRGVDPGLRIGGPNLQDAVSDTWLDANPDHSWTHRFLTAIAARDRHADLDFFSFEHYPFDELCGRLDRKLLEASDILRTDMARLDQDGVPHDIPWVITEYGFSAFSGHGEVELPGALFDADMVAHFLSLGGRSAYLLGYGPDTLYDPENACAGYGELMLFGADRKGRATWPTPAYWGMSMLARDWVEPGDHPHRLYAASVRAAGGRSQAMVVAYPLKRPDDRWSTLLVNRDPKASHAVRLSVVGTVHGAAARLPGPYEVVQYDAGAYEWHAAGSAGHPVRDLPPRRFTLPGGSLKLPPYSLTVVRASAL